MLLFVLSDLKSLQPYVIGFSLFHGLLVGCCCVVRSEIRATLCYWVSSFSWAAGRLLFVLSDLKSLQPSVIGFPLFHGLLVGCSCVVRSAISTKRMGEGMVVWTLDS
jgi:hypothetical protein